MNTAPKETIIIAIFTAIIGGIMVLRNIDALLLQIQHILKECVEYIRLRNERQRLEIEERKKRIAFWMNAIQKGRAIEKLNQLDEKISNK